ncbi:MAG TPA: pyridoxamine 5'-phosphate oxidase family protein [Bryobacteraceae bacterium]|jgi:uncharacterized protein YhbP (UPF0306 family)|nr:pyridoxamine 5'-phosphate oxidase family protein [Bryobacteraceae bacterium]
MTKEALFGFLDQARLAVVSSISPEGALQSALVGIAVSERLEIVFDTLSSTRKYRNLLQHASCAVVIGWDNETTVQFEGEARLLEGEERETYQAVYFRKWPDGMERLRWPGICHFVIRPVWIRYSDYNQATYEITEWRF